MKGVRFLYLSIVFTFCVPVVVPAQDAPPASPESLYRVLPVKTGMERAEIELEIARYHFPINMDSVMYYVQHLEQFLKINYDARIDAFVNKFKGYAAFEKMELAAAMEFSIRALQLFQSLNNYREMAYISMELGTDYLQLGDYKSATEHQLRALGYFEQINHKEGIARVYNELGRISYETGEIKLAQDYFDSALEIFLELDIEQEISRIWNNLGLIMLDNGEPRLALKNLEKAASGFSKQGYIDPLALVLGNIAVCYDELGMLDSGKYYARKALNTSYSTGDEYGIISGLINMGYFLRLEKRYDSCLVYFEDADQRIKKINMPVLEEDIYLEYADLYADMGDYKLAYSYHLKQDSIHSKLLDTESKRRIDELLLSYTQKLKEQEIIQLQRDQKMQSQLNVILILLILLAVIVVIVLVFSLRKFRKQQDLLKEKNDLLNRTNENLERSETELKGLNDKKNKLFSIIAHDLRNPIAAVRGFSELLYKDYDELDNDSRKEFLEQILQASARTMSMLENLLFWAKSQMDQIEIRRSSVAVSELIGETVEQLRSSTEKKGIEVITSFTDELTINVDPEMIKAVLRNLISNAVKFSYPGKRIRIESNNVENTVCISVIDEGTGIQPDILQNLFSSDHMYSTEGTSEEKGTGIGLIISKDFTERNGGTIKVESTLGKGSCFSICLPEN